MANTTAQQAKEQRKEEFLSQSGVVGVGVGTGSGERLQVYVEELNDQVRRQVPQTVDGTPVRVIEAGDVKPLQRLMQTQRPQQVLTPQDATGSDRVERKRPAPGGVSIGHEEISAGTLGLETKEDLILSNNHVLAKSSTPSTARAEKGDPILQPGPYDGGGSEDKIAELEDYAALDPQGENLVDAAVARPDNTGLVTREIVDFGVPKGTSKVVEGQTIKKSGRTTSTTRGTVLDRNATIEVNYGGDIGKIRFEDQIVTTSMSKGGDSGSASLDMNNNVVGLIFAGSSSISIHNKIQNVEQELDITVGKGRTQAAGGADDGLVRAGGLMTSGLAVGVVGPAALEWVRSRL